MSLQGPALVSSVVVHKELLYVYSRGVNPSFFFILPICGLRKILVWWTMIGGDRYGHGSPGRV